MGDPGDQWVIGIGELLWDCFPDRRLPGGAPANVVFHAAALGHPARIASRLGADRAGAALQAEMETHGLSAELLQFDDTRPTGWVTVDDRDPANPDSAPAYVPRSEGCTGRHREEAVRPAE